jgi:nicotinamidase-related amidase
MEEWVRELLDVYRRDVSISELREAKLKAINEYLKPKNLEEACLLIIDMQKGFLKKGAALEVPIGRMECIPSIKRLLVKARQIDLKTVFTKYIHKQDGLRLSDYPFSPEVFEHTPKSPKGPFHPSSCCLNGDPTTEIVEELRPLPNETIVEKHGYDAFLETPLDSELRSRGINYLYVCGVMTDICVDSTIRSAFNKEYRTTVASDAIGTNWLNIQEACIDIWKRKFARVKTVDEILREWSH